MSRFEDSVGFHIVNNWLVKQNKKPFEFQWKTWKAYHQGLSGMVIAPTGFGKTFSVFLAVLIDFLNHPEKFDKGLKLIWITPIRSLAKDLARAMQDAISEIGLDWVVETRNGDTDVAQKAKQSKQMPDVLIVTPESLHLMMAQKRSIYFFEHLHAIAVDEWHELLGNKRGVMVELAVNYLRATVANLKVWGITATIGNIDEAMEVLLTQTPKKVKIISKEKKQIDIIPVYPDLVEDLPWAGHLGSKLAHKIVPLILESKSTLIFTNTRNQSEMWYQLLLDAYPDFAGRLALHHGSIDFAIRQWIEEALSEGSLKAVVCTSSLDLGVDFKPVDTVIQIGSTKGIARFLQRAGRSGHSPYEVSKIYFVPTHSLELIEVAALKEAYKKKIIENREPMVMTYDVLVQFLVTLALGDGFDSQFLLPIIQKTHAFQYLTKEDWDWCLAFITKGGKLGENYDEFHRVEVNEQEKYVVTNRRIGMLHRLNMGAIVSDAMLKVKFLSGGYIGMVEEYFITKLSPGDKFILAGRILEYIRMKELTVYVKNSSGRAITPSWLGGRLPLSSNLSHFLREKLALSIDAQISEKELKFLKPLFQTQLDISKIPKQNEFLVENIQTKEGFHLFMYPFEGRLTHEVMATLVAYRVSLLYPITFTIAMNDYGFELFSDQVIPLTEDDLRTVLDRKNLMQDVAKSINAAEMALHKFRDIAVISGLVTQTFPGKQRNNRSLQASSSVIFKVLEEHEPDHRLVRQAYAEVFNQQLEEVRLQEAFRRIENSKILYIFANQYTPLSFPIKVDSLRQSLSSEDLATRIQKMIERNSKKKKGKK